MCFASIVVNISLRPRVKFMVRLGLGFRVRFGAWFKARVSIWVDLELFLRLR
jgi:hypothetical protein